MKIYTRGGDDGETSIYGGARVSKDHARVAAYGTVDELNSFLGQALAHFPPGLADWRARLSSLQSDGFVVGAMLSSRKVGEETPAHIPRLQASRVEELESWIDELDGELEELEAFILPGGTPAAASLHVARSVSRRAERCVVALSHHEDVDPVVIKYLNRLSDFLFTLARAVNARQGEEDAKWYPR